MKNIIALLALVLLSNVSFAEDNVYKTCTKSMEVEAICAGYFYPHDIDPLFEPEFIYLKKSSFVKVKQAGLNPKEIKDWDEKCDDISGYPLYQLFGDKALPESELEFETIELEFIKECD